MKCVHLAGLRRCIGALALVPLLSACQLDVGKSSVEAEFARKRAAGAFHVVSVENGQAVIMARGRKVNVTPGVGACVAADAIDLSERSAFMLLADCAVAAPVVEAKGGGKRLQMAPAFPGLITLSLAGEPRARTERLEAFLRTPSARRQIARGGGDDDVVVEEIRVIGDAVLVHARNGGETDMPLLSRDFWRAFIDLNGRMGVVTVSGFAAAELKSETMFGEAMRHVLSLQGANGRYVEADTEADVEALTGVAAVAPAEDQVEAIAEVASLDDDLAVVPVSRPDRAVASRGTPVPGMPLPPKRPVR